MRAKLGAVRRRVRSRSAAIRASSAAGSSGRSPSGTSCGSLLTSMTVTVTPWQMTLCCKVVCRAGAQDATPTGDVGSPGRDRWDEPHERRSPAVGHAPRTARPGGRSRAEDGPARRSAPGRGRPGPAEARRRTVPDPGAPPGRVSAVPAGLAPGAAVLLVHGLLGDTEQEGDLRPGQPLTAGTAHEHGLAPVGLPPEFDEGGEGGEEVAVVVDGMGERTHGDLLGPGHAVNLR